MKIAPKTLTGILHSANKGACDWGWQGMLAYGCQNMVVVVDTKTMQVIQVLDRHRGYVVKVKWARENYHHDLASPYTLHLASGDNNGRVIVWDVTQASIRSDFSDGSKPIAELEWLPTQDASHDLLAVLHPPYNLVLWNAATGTKLWKKTYTEILQGFSFDPFDSSRMAFIGQDCVVFVDDFSMSKMPASNGKKYYISTPSAQGTNSNMSGSTSSDKLSGEKKGSKATITKRMSNILVGESSKRAQEEEPVTLNECLQLVYHRACRHHLILLYPREILVLDLDINQTVGIITAERTGSPFMQVIPMRQRDIMMCLHENGSITVRVRRRTNQVQATPVVEQVGTFGSSDDSPTHTFLDVAYDLRCQSDPMRVTKNNRVYGMACDPIGEMRVTMMMSDSRILMWELKTVDYQDGNIGSLQQAISPLYTPGLAPPSQFEALAMGGDKLPLTCSQSYPKMALSDLISQTQSFVSESHVSAAHGKHGVVLKSVLTGLLSGVAPPPLVVRMCPPLTTKNWNVYTPLLALGTSTGIVQIYNLSSGHLSREFSIHSCTVRGIEWVSLHSFLSFSYPTPGPNGLVKNELILTDIQTGKNTHFRANREEESTLEMVRVSYLKQYFVLVFKDKPFELWDLRSGTMLRQMPKNFPHVTALEWSPSHNLKSLKKKFNQETASGTAIPPEPTTPVTAPAPLSASAADPLLRSGDSKTLQSVLAREHFVFTDSDGLLYHFIVEGNVIKDGSKIPPDGGMGSITCIAWKGETMVLGDVDGNLNLWDLKARVSRAVPTHRGWIRKIRFAPGRGNMKLLVLYNDGVDIWDAKEVEIVSSIKSPKEIPKVTDAEWAGSDRPILACADGCVRVLDIKLRQGCSPVDEHQVTDVPSELCQRSVKHWATRIQLTILPMLSPNSKKLEYLKNFMLDPVFSPHLLPPKAALMLKCLLQHQPWNKEYKLHLPETDDNADISGLINEQLSILDQDIRDYLPACPFGTAQRCLFTARLFGDESELIFWTIASHYLRAEKAEPLSRHMPQSVSQNAVGDLFIPSTPAKETHDLLNLSTESQESSGTSSMWSFIKERPLETCFDIMCDNSTFQKYQLDRVSLHDSKRSTYEHTRKCAENLMLLGQTDRAVQLLLETDADNENYYTDSLRACLVASIRSSGASQSTIKLVATNLIANGKLSEGVQLLCLIDKGLDACRYLQTYGAWYQAAWLAKATLNYAECSEVMKRWADHLCSPQVNQKSKAILVMLTLGQFVKVIEMLYSVRQFDRAALFVESCQEFGLLEMSDETKSLVEAVFLEYARLLVSLGNQNAAQYYCHLAGDKGKQLLKEIENLFSK